MSSSTSPPRSPADLLSALLSESQQLRADVQDRERRQRKTIVLIGLGLVFCVALSISVVVLLVQSRQRANDSRDLIRANTATGQRVADCTTAGGVCYEENSRHSAQLIQQLIAAQEQIALCQKRSDTSAELKRCIDTALGPTPTPRPSTSTGS